MLFLYISKQKQQKLSTQLMMSNKLYCLRLPVVKKIGINPRILNFSTRHAIYSHFIQFRSLSLFNVILCSYYVSYVVQINFYSIRIFYLLYLKYQ